MDRNPTESVWPAFVVVFAAMVVSIGAQIVIAVGLTLRHMSGGGGSDPDAIRQATEGFFMSPVGIIVMGGIAQIAFIGSVLIAIRFLPGSRTEQLGLQRPGLPWSSYVTFAVGTGVPVGVGIGLSMLLSLAFEPMVDPAQIWVKITLWTFLPYVLFISLAPGFIEEITFRGFVQRRILRRFGPPVAIACSSVLFAVAHIDPHAILFTLPIGVWLGVIAWRVGAVWPCIVCHAVLNGVWSIYFIAAVKNDATTGFYSASAVVLGAISVVGFVASVRILARTGRQEGS